MSEPWGTREQPSEPQPAEPEPTPLGAEHLLLAVGGVSFTTACVLALVDQAGVTDAVRGLYSILTGLFVVGITGYLVRSGQARVRSRVDCYAHLVLDRLAELTSQVDALTTAVNELRAEAGKAHVTYLPAAPKQYQGTRYLSTAVGGQGDTVPVQPGSGLDADTIAAARAVARRLADSPD